jgi:hypothetical protein
MITYVDVPVVAPVVAPAAAAVVAPVDPAVAGTVTELVAEEVPELDLLDEPVAGAVPLEPPELSGCPTQLELAAKYVKTLFSIRENFHIQPELMVKAAVCAVAPDESRIVKSIDVPININEPSILGYVLPNSPAAMLTNHV